MVELSNYIEDGSLSKVSEITEATEYVIPSQVTDNAIDNWLAPHYVVIDESVASNDKLFLFLPGSGGEPLRQKLITQQAAALGYHAINLSYANSHDKANSIAKLCKSSEDINCHENLRKEVVYGIDSSPEVDVNSVNSVENRLVKLLQYLDQQNPHQGWSNYLQGDAPQWDSIVVAGHSQGAGHAAYIAEDNLVDGVLMFSAPADYSRVSKYIAPWIDDNHATPTDRYYGFVHAQDHAINKVQKAWQLMGLDTYGSFVNVDEQPVSDSDSHLFVTAATPSRVGKEHGSVVVDHATPKLSDGTPLYQDVWTHLLNAPIKRSSEVEEVDTIEQPQNEDTLVISDDGNREEALQDDAAVTKDVVQEAPINDALEVTIDETVTDIALIKEAPLNDDGQKEPSLGDAPELEFTGKVLDLTALPGQQIKADLTIAGDSDYQNTGGFYRVIDELGTVQDPLTGAPIAPSEAGYEQAALRNSLGEFSEATTESLVLFGGFSYAPYLLAEDEQAYFPFLEANADGVEHMQVQESGSFAFEDTFGGGDFSYDDLTIDVDLSFV